MIECDCCKGWYHRRCERILPEFICPVTNELEYFTCKECRGKGNWHQLLNTWIKFHQGSLLTVAMMSYVMFFLFFSMNRILQIHVNKVKPVILRSAGWIPHIESKLHHVLPWCNFDSIRGIQIADRNMRGFTVFTCICTIIFIDIGRNKKKQNIKHHRYSQQWFLTIHSYLAMDVNCLFVQLNVVVNSC